MYMEMGIGRVRMVQPGSYRKPDQYIAAKEA
jgi:hypothetical protein